MKQAIISGLKGGLVGSLAAISVFTTIDFLFPTPDMATVSLNTVELVGLVEVGPGVCQYDYLDTADNSIVTLTSACPEVDQTN